MPISAEFGRDEGADLGEEREKGVLAQEGRFAGHVRAGQEPERARARVVGAEVAVVGDEAAAGAAERLLDDRVAAAADAEGAALGDLGPRPVLGAGEVG